MSTPHISVVMAVYNASLYIREAMNSILKQTFTDFEFIIINDASNDSTLAIIKSFKDDRIKLFNNETNLGQTPSLNKGIELAQGKYIARMDADDIASLNRFELQNNFLERNETVAVLGTSYSILGTNIEKRLNYSSEEIAVRLFFGKNSIGHPTVMARKAIFIHNGIKYNEENQVNQDFELWADLAWNYKIANLSECLLEYRVHDEQISTKRYKEQQFHTKRIVTKQLKYFNAEVTEQDIQNHLILIGLETVASHNFKEVVIWSQRLITINARLKKFHKLLFETYVNDLLNQQKLKMFNTSYILATTYTPILLKSFFMDWIAFQPRIKLSIFLKFFIKCLLFANNPKNKNAA